MITEQQLKADCRPELIKKMVELAEGFDCIEESEHDVDYLIWNNKRYFTSSDVLFPLLIHRAVEGYNKQYPHKYVLNSIDNIVWFDGCIKDFVEIKNYSPSSLTHAECAMLHCLQEVIK